MYVVTVFQESFQNLPVSDQVAQSIHTPAIITARVFVLSILGLPEYTVGVTDGLQVITVGTIVLL